MPAFARRIAVVIAASATVLGAAACGGGVSKDKFTSELVKKAGLTEAQATCVTDKLYAELSQDEIDNLYKADKVEDTSEKERKTLTEAAVSCASPSGGSTTDTGSTTGQ